MNIRYIALISAVIAGVAAPVASQTEPTPPRPPQPPVIVAPAMPADAVDALYDHARDAIERGRYDTAVQQFTRLAAMKTARADAALYWKAYSLEKIGQRDDALTTLADLQKQFADSRWIRDAKALEVEIRQAAGQSVSPDTQNDGELKLLALRGLVRSDPDRALPLVEKMLTGTDTPRVKDRALFVLSQSRDAGAREIVASIAKGTGNPDLQLKAIAYLGMMNGGDPQVLDEIYKSASDMAVKRAVLRSFLMARDQDRLVAIARTDMSADLRGQAVQMLGELRATTAFPELYRAESSPDVKKRIVSALFVARNASALVELARTEKNPAMKSDIVSKLSMMKTKEATDYLLELLK